MNMIERVARAIDPDVWESNIPIPTRGDTLDFHERRQKSCALARAFFEAAREPTSEILDAPAMRDWIWNDGNPVTDGELKDAWQAMIDAALQESKEAGE
ncbi:hypothetical protein [Rhizobium sp. WW_1]|uniref:hypothetical protein n=1 Tax=Rhizobium sp. WW_1 TaxID=1907375 RepID=UPI0006456C2C|nr:hypothetical protein [Rhizobium sp. WW_1]RKD68949.1 hypothetical protein BJ928_10487 [Rhizobium sp. WW_1]